MVLDANYTRKRSNIDEVFRPYYLVKFHEENLDKHLG